MSFLLPTALNSTLCAWTGCIFGICTNQGRHEAAAIMPFILALLIISYTTIDIIYNKIENNE